ncbi:hypothetical protein HOC01_01985 [archaeon]|jgi:hypothetical protein|nr:hypothetical protein [archaeon]MBT6697909.1 hypothetical protein [archaeon]
MVRPIFICGRNSGGVNEALIDELYAALGDSFYATRSAEEADGILRHATKTGDELRATFIGGDGVFESGVTSLRQELGADAFSELMTFAHLGRGSGNSMIATIGKMKKPVRSLRRLNEGDTDGLEFLEIPLISTNFEGIIGGRRFYSLAGIGLDGQIIRDAEEHRKKGGFWSTRGLLGYLASISTRTLPHELRRLFEKLPDVTFNYDPEFVKKLYLENGEMRNTQSGKIVNETWAVMLGGIRNVGNGATLFPSRQSDEIEMRVLKGPKLSTLPKLFLYGPRLFLDGSPDASVGEDYVIRRGGKVTVSFQDDLPHPVQVGGTYVGGSSRVTFGYDQATFSVLNNKSL